VVAFVTLRFLSTSLSLIEKGLDKFCDEFLLSPWELDGFLEDELKLSSRPWPAGGWAMVGEEILDSDAYPATLASGTNADKIHSVNFVQAANSWDSAWNS
jgi:hypothetical protein